jgi:hypothetical protein
VGADETNRARETIAPRPIATCSPVTAGHRSRLQGAARRAIVSASAASGYDASNDRGRKENDSVGVRTWRPRRRRDRVDPRRGGARTALLTTAPLELQGTNSFGCLIANVGTKDIELSFAILNASGTPVFSSVGTVVLAPLHQTGVGGVASALSPRLCQITVVQGRKKSVRAPACIFDSGATCIANSEAR